jgi:hypothetical protein
MDSNVDSLPWPNRDPAQSQHLTVLQEKYRKQLEENDSCRMLLSEFVLFHTDLIEHNRRYANANLLLRSALRELCLFSSHEFEAGFHAQATALAVDKDKFAKLMEAIRSHDTDAELETMQKLLDVTTPPSVGCLHRSDAQVTPQSSWKTPCTDDGERLGSGLSSDAAEEMIKRLVDSGCAVDEASDSSASSASPRASGIKSAVRALDKTSESGASSASTGEQGLQMRRAASGTSEGHDAPLKRAVAQLQQEAKRSKAQPSKANVPCPQTLEKLGYRQPGLQPKTDIVAQPEAVAISLAAASDHQRPKSPSKTKSKASSITTVGAPLPVGRIVEGTKPLFPVGTIGMQVQDTKSGDSSDSGSPNLEGFHLRKAATTLVIRNIPARCSQAHLMKTWPARGSYNMLYLPYNIRQHHTMGYAFVNFISVEAAQQFRAKWHGFDLVPEAQTKRLDIGDAKVQGLYNNLVIVMRSHKKGKPIDPARLPAVFAKNGSVRFSAGGHWAECRPDIFGGG